MTDDATDKSPIVRLTGFQVPYSRDQYISCAGHLLSSAALYACLTAMVAHSRTNPVLTEYESKERYIVIALLVHLVIMILLLSAWYSCESCDPGETSDEPKPWFGIVMKGPRWEKTKYCAVCRKTVPGMDHHCTWLNTCVGRKNYAQFFTIAICGVAVFSLQALVSIYLLVDWNNWQTYYSLTSFSSIAIQMGFGFCTFLSIPCFIMYFTLLLFHLYLAWLGYGTYDYYLKQRDIQRAKRRQQQSATVELTHRVAV